MLLAITFVFQIQSYKTACKQKDLKFNASLYVVFCKNNLQPPNVKK